MNAYGTDHVDRGARRMLAAMIFCGIVLTALSFTMQLGAGAVKSRLQGLVTDAGSFMSSPEVKSR
jgi:hypothetical protein